MVRQSQETTIANVTDLDATTAYEIDFEYVASAAFFAKWTKTAVTGSIIAQWSCNGHDWVDIGSSSDINAVLLYAQNGIVNQGYRYLRILVTIGSGKLDTFKLWYNCKG